MCIDIFFPSAFIVGNLLYFSKIFYFLLPFIIIVEKLAINHVRISLKVICIFSDFFEDFLFVLRFQ